MSLTTIQDALSSLLAAVATAAQKVGMEQVPTEEYSFSWWECSSPAAKELQIGTEREPSFRNFFSTLFPGVDEHEGPSEFQKLKLAAQEYERALAVHHVLFGLSAWKLIYDYLVNEMGGHVAYDYAAVVRTCKRYDRALRAQPIRTITTLVFRDFDATEAFAVAPGVEFRRVTPEDYRTLGRNLGEAQFLTIQKPFVPSSLDWICTITLEIARPSDIAIPWAIIERLLAALTLTTSGRADVHLVGTGFDEYYIKSGELSRSMALFTARSGGRMIIQHEDIVTLSRYYAKLATVDDEKRLSYQRVPLRRLRLSTARESVEDVLVDLVVGLEALLAPDSNTAETTYRFRLRGAAILAEVIPGDGAARIKMMNRLYASRSDAVHGRTVTDLRQLVDMADNALRNLILWFLMHPDAVAGAKKIVADMDASMVDRVVQAALEPSGGDA